MFKLLFILLLFAINLCIVNLEEYNNEEDNLIEYDDFIFNGRRMNIDAQKDDMAQLIRDYFSPLKEFRTTELIKDESFKSARRMNVDIMNLPEAVDSTIICYKCLLIAKTLLRYYHSQLPIAYIKKIVTQFCIKSEIVPAKVCKGLIDLNLPIIVYILDRKPELTATDICNIFSQSSCLRDTNYKSKIKSYNYFAKNIPKKIPKKFNKQKSLTPLKIIQISDIHYDPAYIANSNAKCKDPLCCREGSGDPETNESAAGSWGDYRSCDVPHKLIENAFEEIKQRHPDAAMIFYTGDSVAHNIWSTTFDEVKTSIHQITKDLKNYFPNITIYPILGNHDTQPLNQFAPTDVDGPHNTTWLYDYIAEDWKDFLPVPALNTFRQYGFYAVHHSEHLKIISLNSNVAYTYNWWLLYDDEFFTGQLEWLVIELIQSEMQGQYVYILSHIPPGEGDTYIKWQIEYQNIKVRFAHIIQGEFVGHTHMDQIRIVYNTSNGTDPVSVVYNGGSLTPFENVNPNYRIYYANPNTFEIIDYEQWIFNLTKANEDQSAPEWYPLYTFKAAYNLNSTEPSNLNQFIENLKTNITLFQQYRRYELKNSHRELEECKDKQCKRKKLCEIVTTIFKDHEVCDSIIGSEITLKSQQSYDIRDNSCYKSLKKLTKMIAGTANYVECLSKCHV